MFHELENILKALEKIDAKTQKNVFKSGEIQKEQEEINDFTELLDDIQHKTTLLQQADINNINNILLPLIELNASLGSCVNDIELVRNLVKKLITHLSKNSSHSDDA